MAYRVEKGDLPGRQRGAEARDDVVEAGLVRHQRVGVALDDDGLVLAPDRALGPVDEIERPALVEERGRRGVEVLGPLAFEEAAAEADRMTALVPDGEDDARPELVIDAATAARPGRGEPDLDELLGAHVALGLERPGHLVPARRRPAELVRLDGLVREAAIAKVRQRHGGLVDQDRVVEGDRAVEDLAQAGLVGILALRPLIDLDAGATGQRAERLRERHAVPLHDEAEDVPTQPAPEAMPALTDRGDHERRRLLAVERTEALVGGARLLECDGLADDLDDRQLALDLGCDTDRQTAPPALPPNQNASPRPIRSSAPTARSRT